MMYRRKMAALALLATGAPLAAHAQTQDIPLGFSAGPGLLVEHDSNFFRTSGFETVLVPGTTTEANVNVPVTGVTEEEASLQAAFHEMYGRQTVTANANVGRVHFQQEGQYDYTAEQIHGDLSSDLPYRVQTDLSFDRGAQLARFADIGTPARDIISTNAAAGALYFPIAYELLGTFSGNASHTTNSAGGFATMDLDTHELDGGVRYASGSDNHVDLLFRNAIGTYPNGSPSIYISPSYHDRGVDLRVDYSLTGTSHLQGRAGYLERRNDDLVIVNEPAAGMRTRGAQEIDINRNFAGPAFELTYMWQATRASRLTVYGTRQIGAAGDNNYLSAVSHTYRFTPAYLPTERLEFDAYYEWGERNYFGDYAILTGSTPGTIRVDTTHNSGVSAHWGPRRWLTAVLDLHRESRDSNIAYWRYTDNVVSLNLQALFSL